MISHVRAVWEPDWTVTGWSVDSNEFLGTLKRPQKNGCSQGCKKPPPTPLSFSIRGRHKACQRGKEITFILITAQELGILLAETGEVYIMRGDASCWNSSNAGSWSVRQENPAVRTTQGASLHVSWQRDVELEGDVSSGTRPRMRTENFTHPGYLSFAVLLVTTLVGAEVGGFL